MLVTRRVGAFLKQFAGPGENGIVCFRFWQAVVASGCPGECAYCFLQTQTPYRTGLYDLKGTIFENLRDMVPEAVRWLHQPVPAGLIVGENQDGLAFERAYKREIGVTPLELLVPLFEHENPVGHTLIILSKFTTTEFVEALGPAKNVVFSWSLSLPTISKQYEKKVAPLDRRLETATRLKAAGYRVRFRLDALCPIEGWEEELADVVSRVNAIEPEMLTIGALRASNVSNLRRAAAANGRDASIFRYISTQDPSGFKYRTEHEFHVGIFRRIKDLLNPRIALGLCKEDVSLWREVGLDWTGCHCLHGTDDDVTEPRVQLVGLARRRPAAASPLPLFR